MIVVIYIIILSFMYLIFSPHYPLHFTEDCFVPIPVFFHTSQSLMIK